MFYLSRSNPFKFFKGFLPQILLGPFLNTLSQIYMSALQMLYHLKKLFPYHINLIPLSFYNNSADNPLFSYKITSIECLKKK